MLLLYSIPTIVPSLLFDAAGRGVSGDAMSKPFLQFFKRLLMRDTVVSRLRDTRDLIRGCIPSGACGTYIVQIVSALSLIHI